MKFIIEITKFENKDNKQWDIGFGIQRIDNDNNIIFDGYVPIVIFAYELGGNIDNAHIIQYAASKIVPQQLGMLYSNRTQSSDFFDTLAEQLNND